MAQVMIRAEATQSGEAGTLQGYLSALVPALSPAEWVEAASIQLSDNIVGADAGHLYVTRRQDSGLADNDVYRVSADGAGSEMVAGLSIGRTYGKVTLVLPLGQADAILFGRLFIARIQGDEELWRISVSGQVGTVLADGAALAGSTATVVYQRADFSNFRQMSYKAFSFSIDSPVASTDMAAWDSYAIDWDAIQLQDPEIEPYLDPAAVIAMAAPNLDYGVSLPQTRSSDGWNAFLYSVLTDAFTEDGDPAVTYYGQTDINYPDVNLSSNTATLTVTGGVITAASLQVVPLGSSVSDLPLPPLEPGYSEWSLYPYFTYAVSLEPAPPPEDFWTNLRRAVEVV